MRLPVWLFSIKHSLLQIHIFLISDFFYFYLSYNAKLLIPLGSFKFSQSCIQTLPIAKYSFLASHSPISNCLFIFLLGCSTGCCQMAFWLFECYLLGHGCHLWVYKSTGDNGREENHIWRSRLHNDVQGWDVVWLFLFPIWKAFWIVTTEETWP